MLASLMSRKRTASPAADARGAKYHQIIQKVADDAGGLGIEVVDIAGNVEEVAARVKQQAELFRELLKLGQQMSGNNKTVGAAARRAQQVATAANQDVESSRATIGESLQDIQQLTGSVTEIEAELSGLNDALQGVAQVASGISVIAKQTNLLALNATIEATRAGEVGRGFAVVAEHVKELAKQTADATAEIHDILKELTELIEDLISRGADSTLRAQTVQEGTAAIREVVETVGSAMTDVDGESARIARSVVEIDDYCVRTVSGLEGMAGDVERSARALEEAQERTVRLLGHSEELIRVTCVEGVETVDTPYIRTVREVAATLGGVFEAALERGEISEGDLFDQDYRLIPNTDPPQHMTRFVAFTDRVLPAIQEPVVARMKDAGACVAMDVNGFLPTHMKLASQPQRPGDPAWNMANCRNRRILSDRVAKAAAANTNPFLLQTYRANFGGGKWVSAKDCSAPIYARGKHWGCLRLTYFYDSQHGNDDS